MYLGILDPDWNQMRKLLNSLPAYQCSIIVRIWSGVPMTLAHRNTVDPTIDAMCPCGEADQTLSHLMWGCPLLAEKRPRDLTWWASGPPAAVNALIPQTAQPTGYIRDWRKVCRWAITALQERLGMQEHNSEVPQDPPPSAVFPYSKRGHLVCISVSGTYTYCSKCYIARKLRDHSFICVKPCAKETSMHCGEGDYLKTDQHIARVLLMPWKTAALRPKFCCLLCGQERWATSGFRALCGSA